jgi:hypothetical protein
MNFRKSAIVGTIIALAHVTAHSELIDIPGTSYNFDSLTSLYWLDAGVTSSLSYQQLVLGIGNSWYAQGWRLASGSEVNALFASNFPSLTTAPAHDANGQPFYGGDLSDFYAPTQIDTLGSVSHLISVLGGRTITFGTDAYGIVALFDRETTCNGGCSSHAMATIATYFDGRAEASLAGGMQDTVAYPQYGRFLVSSSIAVVPEPPASAMLVAGILCLVLVPKVRRARIHLAGVA